MVKNASKSYWCDTVKRAW